MIRMSKEIYIKSIEKKSNVGAKTVFQHLEGKTYYECEYYSEDIQIDVLFSDGNLKQYEFHYYRGEANYFSNLVHSIICKINWGEIESLDLKQEVDDLYNRFGITERVKEMRGY